MLIKLMLGVRQFKNKPFKKMQAIFEQLSERQNPDILFITCVDSRVIPSLFTQSLPGELFVHRNVGNIVPAYPNKSSEAATIKYALKVLHIKDIIICGHSDCGAVKALLTAPSESEFPSISSWLSHSQSVLKEIDAETDRDSLEVQAIKKNVLAQIEHLKTYPLVAEKLVSQELTLHGWFYQFETGEVFIHDPKHKDFISLEHAFQIAIEERRNKIVKAIAMDYLAQFTQPQTANAYRTLMQLFSQIQEDITDIWEQIKGPVSYRLWAELGDLYTGPTDPEFSTLVELGAQVTLDKLKDFQHNVRESAGYHQYCSQLICHTLFAKSAPPLKLPIIIPREVYSHPSF